MDISDVLLPIAPFTETAGTFVNAEGRVQSFHGCGASRWVNAGPAWKVLRVLGQCCWACPGFDVRDHRKKCCAQLACAANPQCTACCSRSALGNVRPAMSDRPVRPLPHEPR